MDLPNELLLFLTPLLPYLLKASEKATEEAGKKLGSEAWEQAKALWGKLCPKVKAKPAAQEAIADVAANPQDEDALAALRLQLKKILGEDPALAAEVACLLEEAKAVGATVSVSGDRSIAIGGDVSNSTIITGDSNKIGR